MKASTLLPPRIDPPRATPGRVATGRLCDKAMGRILAFPGEPLLYADWDRTLMVHYEIDPALLRPHVPYPLDLHKGRAYVTLVMFNLKNLRPRAGARLGRWLMRPLAEHGFLNVRTYVRLGNETGIYFITEYMDNLLALKLGPLAFGLPYRLARLDYRHDWLRGAVTGRAGGLFRRHAFAYEARLDPATRFAPARRGSLTEWLMERYTAFTVRRGRRLLFRVWHNAWPAVAVEAKVRDDTLLRADLPWFTHARYVGAHFSPGVFDVWMGRPHPVADVPA